MIDKEKIKEIVEYLNNCKRSESFDSYDCETMFGDISAVRNAKEHNKKLNKFIKYLKSLEV